MKMKIVLAQGVLVTAIAMSSLCVVAADKTNEGARTTSKNEVVTKSKDGVEVHSVKGADKMDRERKEKREQEAKAKK